MLALHVLCAGCGYTRHPIPLELMTQAEVIDFPGIRASGENVAPIQQSLSESIRQAMAQDPRGTLDETGRFNVLTISGGGANGAFGAGLLCGWTEAGTRPTFKLVTGISTGALIAPFAFAGPEYDDTLRRFYTGIRTADVLKIRPLISVLFGAQSLADTTPLEALLRQSVGVDLLEAIAREHARGRRLFIGTTNLDSGRLVVWDMGAIAASDAPHRIELFRKVMRASAAIPGAFPPEYFAVEAGGGHYDEMHVDGGVIAQAFLYGVPVDTQALRREAGPLGEALGRVYVIRNGRLVMPPDNVEPRLLPILERSINGLIDAQAVGDLFRLHTVATQDKMEFKLAHIPDDFQFRGQELFDPVDMKALFELGYGLAKCGYPWLEKPPGFEVPDV